MNSNNQSIKATTREQAIEWWSNLSVVIKFELRQKYYGRGTGKTDETMKELIYLNEKETQSATLMEDSWDDFNKLIFREGEHSAEINREDWEMFTRNFNPPTKKI